LFIVAVVFFSGFALGLHSGGSGHFGHRHWHNGMMMGRGEPPMMRPGGGPGFYPGGPGGSGPESRPADTDHTDPLRSS